jgi:transcriptional regulator with XRE-family HTH domain
VSRGDEIRRLREVAGFSLEDLSRKVGLAISTLSNVETGKRALSLDEYTTIIGALDALRQERDDAWAEAQVAMGFGRRVPEMGVVG